LVTDAKLPLHSHEKFDCDDVRARHLPTRPAWLNLYSHEFTSFAVALAAGGMMAQGCRERTRKRWRSHGHPHFPVGVSLRHFGGRIGPNNLATYTVSVLDDSVRALYLLLLGHRIRARASQTTTTPTRCWYWTLRAYGPAGGGPVCQPNHLRHGPCDSSCSHDTMKLSIAATGSAISGPPVSPAEAAAGVVAWSEAG